MSFEISDDLSPSVTPIQVSPGSSHDDKEEQNRTLAFRVYKEVWDEFNKWKVEDCKQHLLSLQNPLPPPEVAEATSRVASTLCSGESGDVEIVYLCDTNDDIPLDVNGATVLLCKAVPLELPDKFEPHPRYESCTPSVQTIALRVGSVAHEELDVVPFVPYANDPTFDAKEHLGQFERFAWENLVDPDVEVIQFETLRRLHTKHGLSLDDIDSTNILPTLRINNRSGLIYQMTQRDELFWTGTADLPTSIDGVEHRKIDFRAHEPDIDNLRGRIESVVPNFCAIPTCVQALCPQHVQEFPPVPPAIPRVASNDYPNGKSCGDMCFREMDETFQEDYIQWGDPDVDELLCILEIIPDTLPCGLAKLVRKPCREVWVQRRRLIPDDRIYPESDRTRKEKFEKLGSIEKYVPPDPCVHVGPCDQNNLECTCAKRLAYCSRRCLCSVTCRRRQGCSCKSKGKKQTCTDNNCLCRKRGWECDPTVCKCDLYDSRKGKARIKQVSTQQRQVRPDDKYLCQNSELQRGRAAKLEIKPGAYGLGAFAIDKILKGQLIGEYVGELMSESDSGKRGILRHHVDLNYNFELNPTIHIDSARVGNETRYLNHGDGDSANAHAMTKLVLGEQRIGIFALRNIRAGEEVRFDYGKTYWSQGEVEDHDTVTTGIYNESNK